MAGDRDLKIEVEAQNPRPRTLHTAVSGEREQFAAGYATLDQADQSEYGNKERRGLSRDANYPRRWC